MEQRFTNDEEEQYRGQKGFLGHMKYLTRFYKTKKCPSKKCTRGEKCAYAHSEEEIRKTLDLEKTKLCDSMKKFGKCCDESCRYAHCKEELRHTQHYYKTKVCHMWKKGKCTMGITCRHAHGPEELKHYRAVSRKTTLQCSDFQVWDDNPRVCNDKSRVWDDNPRISNGNHQVWGCNPRVWEGNPRVWDGNPRVWDGNPRVLDGNYQYNPHDARISDGRQQGEAMDDEWEEWCNEMKELRDSLNDEEESDLMSLIMSVDKIHNLSKFEYQIISLIVSTSNFFRVDECRGNFFNFSNRFNLMESL